ncbi:MAG: ATP-binding protein [Nanoarchaeota archaeon]|nr:ATP-binding protein [Nanoarchaeota archaeon]
MSYNNYHQFKEDVGYLDEIDEAGSSGGRYHDICIVDNAKKKLAALWLEGISNKYEDTKHKNNLFGKFIKKYDLPCKEFACLLELMHESSDSIFRIRKRHTADNDPFRKYKVKFESSKLKKNKLVFKLVDPKEPMNEEYRVSYKAQLELKNKKYTEEYEQLDMVLEEESQRNSPDSLDSLYYVIQPKTNFDDLIVEEKIKQDLLAAAVRASQTDLIFKRWGLGEVIEYGRGTTLNFRGPPGTGKTMAAHCLANELGKKLLMVRYDQLQNCYVGETEKNIQRVFKLAKTKKAVLFFDEADAIALDRSTLRSSFEMSEVNTLLKELERFDGVCIFATNFAEKYDKAFERRLTMHIDFELPNKEQASLILDKLLPKKSRDRGLCLSEVNVGDLSGGEIKNLVLNAAGFAAKDSSEKICRKHLQEAIVLVRKTKLMQDDSKYFG